MIVLDIAGISYGIEVLLITLLNKDKKDDEFPFIDCWWVDDRVSSARYSHSHFSVANLQ